MAKYWAAVSVSAPPTSISAASGPLLLVSNEIGLGLSPLSPEARRFVDHLGHLHQIPDDAQYAAIGRLDVVMVPVDGGYTAK